MRVSWQTGRTQLTKTLQSDALARGDAHLCTQQHLILSLLEHLSLFVMRVTECLARSRLTSRFCINASTSRSYRTNIQSFSVCLDRNFKKFSKKCFIAFPRTIFKNGKEICFFIRDSNKKKSIFYLKSKRFEIFTSSIKFIEKLNVFGI